MSNAELRLRYTPSDEWTGQLHAAVTSGMFSGVGSAWFDRQRLKETFVPALRKFPLSASDPPVIESGFWSKESDIVLECHLRIAIRPYNVRGALLVKVELATECWTTPDDDQQHTVVVRFLTEYAALDNFASSLEQVLDGKLDTAALPGVAK